MFPLIGCFFVLSWLCWGIVSAIKGFAALAQGRIARGVALLFPLGSLVVLFCVGHSVNDFEAQANPRAVYAEVFGAAPPAKVTNLRGYRDEDELSQIYLQFNAPPEIVALLKSSFIHTGREPEKWRAAPAWFDRRILAQTEICELKTSPANSEFFLLYDPAQNRVRIFFESPGSVSR